MIGIVEGLGGLEGRGQKGPQAVDTGSRISIAIFFTTVIDSVGISVAKKWGCTTARVCVCVCVCVCVVWCVCVCVCWGGGGVITKNCKNLCVRNFLKLKGVS